LIILTFQMATLTDTSRSFTMPGHAGMHLNRQTLSTVRPQKKPWQSRRPPSFRSSKSQTRRDPEIDRLSQEISAKVVENSTVPRHDRRRKEKASLLLERLARCLGLPRDSCYGVHVFCEV
jgi:hypothetical protein